MHKILIATVLIVSLAACKSKSAFNYNQKLVKIEQSLTPDVEKAEADVAAFNANAQYDSIAKVGERMEKLIDTRIKELEDESSPDVKEGESFKRAYIQYFKYMKSAYTGYRDYGNAKTDEDRESALSRIKDIVATKDAVVADLRKGQMKYAEANGFKVQQ
jgi:hypothetical protein